MACKCSEEEGFRIDCPVHGIDSPERDLWCACGDHNMTCPVHVTACPDCNGELTVDERLRYGKCVECYESDGE